MYAERSSGGVADRKLAACVAALVLAFPGLAPAAPAGAGEVDPPRWHLFSGVDITGSSAFGHQGLIWSPCGHLHEPGLRVRALLSGGGFTYRTEGFDVIGQSLAGAIMPGYAWLAGTHGVNLYAGAVMEETRTRPHDPGKPRQGVRGGVAALVEGWWRVSEGLLVEASVAGATANRSYEVRLAAAIDVAGFTVIEPEFVVFGEPGYRQKRLGVFGEVYRSPFSRVLVGGGWAYDNDGSSYYAGVQFKHWR